MRRSNGGPRYYGPYKHGDVWRVHVVRTTTVDGRRKRATTYEIVATRDEGEALVFGARDEAQGITVMMAVDEYLAECTTNQLAQTTVDNYRFRLRRLLDTKSNSGRPIRWVLPRGAELYTQSIRGASDTHINGLTVGRMWGAWCVEKRYLRANPFARVKPRGRKTKGSTKARLSVNESRVLEAYCLARGDEQDCVLTYGYMMLGKRASELARIRVRDLDDDGWWLRITEAKTEASVGGVPLTPQIREMLLGLAQGRATDARLFVNMDGSPMSRFVARDRVRAVTKAAIGREVPPQELRRTFVDNSSRQGFALRTIAEQTGHTSPVVTKRSYMAPEQVAAAAVERNFKLIAGGKR